MSLRIPQTGYRTRWIVILYAVVVFFWLGLEDSDIVGVTVLGSGLSGLALGLWFARRYGGRDIPSARIPLATMVLGAVFGTGASVATATLMLFKDVRHAHAFPDYPAQMIFAILQRVPVWAVAGALFGLGVGLLWMAIKQR